MQRNQILHALQIIFRDVFDDPDLLLREELRPSDVLNWDSLTHIGLITVIEKQYKIRFSLAELDEIKNVGDIVSLIEKKVS